MNVTKEQVRQMARAINLEIPEAEVHNVSLRLSSLLTAMEAIERELGPQMDLVDPVPPVFPIEDAGITGLAGSDR